MLEIELSVDDLKKAQAKMEQMAMDLAGPPIVGAIRDAILIIQRGAKQYAPVNTGRLRASIVPEMVVSQRPASIVGIVGSNVAYAPHVEYGTKPHWPPFGPDTAIERWAELHKTEAIIVAAAIARRGTKAIRFLGRSVEDNEGRIQMMFEMTAKKMLDK